MRDFQLIWEQLMDKLETSYENEVFNEIIKPCNFH